MTSFTSAKSARMRFTVGLTFLWVLRILCQLGCLALRCLWAAFELARSVRQRCADFLEGIWPSTSATGATFQIQTRSLTVVMEGCAYLVVCLPAVGLRMAVHEIAGCVVGTPANTDAGIRLATTVWNAGLTKGAECPDPRFRIRRLGGALTPVVLQKSSCTYSGKVFSSSGAGMGACVPRP